MNYLARAQAAYAAAEAAEHLRDIAAFKSAARAWETLARGDNGHSWEPHRQALRNLKSELATSMTDLQMAPPPAPRGPPPAKAAPWLLKEPATIEF